MVQFSNIDREFGWPEGIVASLIQQESSGNTNAVGPQTRYGRARGAAQFIPATRQHMIDRYGVDPWSTDINVAARAAGLYLNELYQRYNGNIEMALAAYNTGPGNVDRVRSQPNWLSRLARQTQDYVPRIMGRLGSNIRFNAAASAWNPEEHTEEENRYRAEMNRGRLGALGIDSVTDPSTGQPRSVADMGIGELLGLAVLAIFAQAAASAPNLQPDTLQKTVPGPDANRDATVAPAAASAVTSPAAAAIAARPTTPGTLAPADRSESLPSPTTPSRLASVARSVVPA